MNSALGTRAAGASAPMASTERTKPRICVATSVRCARSTLAALPGSSWHARSASKRWSPAPLLERTQSSEWKSHRGAQRLFEWGLARSNVRSRVLPVPQPPLRHGREIAPRSGTTTPAVSFSQILALEALEETPAAHTRARMAVLPDYEGQPHSPDHGKLAHAQAAKDQRRRSGWKRDNQSRACHPSRVPARLEPIECRREG